MRNFLLLGALILAGCNDLNDETLRKWDRVSDSSRDKFIAEHFAADAKYVKKCITRMASLPNTDNVKVTDAGQMCMTGLRLKERDAKFIAAKNAKKI